MTMKLISLTWICLRILTRFCLTLRPNKPSSLNFAYYLNINSVRNKFEKLKEIINKNVDIFTTAETKFCHFTNGTWRIPFTILPRYYDSKNLTYLTTLNTLNILKNILMQYSQKPTHFINFSGKSFFGWC